MNSQGYKALKACEEQLSIVNRENNELRRRLAQQDLIIQKHSHSARELTLTRKDYFIGQILCGYIANGTYGVLSDSCNKLIKDLEERLKVD